MSFKPNTCRSDGASFLASTKSCWSLLLLLHIFGSVLNIHFTWEHLRFDQLRWLCTEWLTSILLKINKMTEALMIILLFLFGFSIINGNVKKPLYSLNETWLCFISYCQYIGVFLFLNWMKGVISLYIVMLVYVVVLNMYNNLKLL